MKTTGTPAVEWPPGGASSAKSAASPGRGPTDFGALLDKHQARTAVAEGPKKEAKLDKKVERESAKDKASAPASHCEQPKAEAKQPEAAAPATGEQQQAQPEGEQPQEQPTVETPVVVVDPLVEMTQPVLAEPQQPQQEQPAQPEAQAPVAEQPVTEVPVQQQPVAAEQVPVPVEAPVTPPVDANKAPEVAASDVKPQPQQPQQPTAPVAADGAPAEAPVVDDSQPQQPVARADKPAQPQAAPQQGAQQQQGDQQPQKQGADQRPADQPRAQAPVQQQVRPEAPAQRVEHHVPAPAPQAQAPVTAPAGTPAPQAVANAAPQALQRSVPLSRAAEAVENVIRLGSARGVTHARMSLRPADLGGVEIRLQQTSHGLVASVVADGVEAAQALQQAGADLRRQLESHGIELQRLDISYSGDDRSGARSSEAQAGMGEGRSQAGETDSHATDGGDLTPTDDTAMSTLELPDGVLVDVLA